MKMNLTTSEKNRGIVRFLLMSMLLCLLIHPAQAQDRVTVTGRLTDTSHAPLSGWMMTAGRVNRKSAFTVMRAAKARSTGTRLRLPKNMKLAIPIPVPNTIVALKMCSVLTSE